MADRPILPRPVFPADLFPEGAGLALPGVRFAEGSARGLVHLARPREAGLPGPWRWAEHDGLVLIALAPGQWLVEGPEAGLETEAASRFGGFATDVTDGYVPFRLSGPLAPAVLARLSSLDYGDEVFSVGAAARTPMMQIGVVIRRLADEDGPAFAMETPRSTARDFAHDVRAATISAVSRE
ncbi:MAG: sarcosine oxidase subunit gamma [Pikeienuella sp.]|uniref:sarcosine oxidase subunit gamma n=1 Tax=Pikeienuella sp. TaxID=2831957 RepID=UPI003918AEB0